MTDKPNHDNSYDKRKVAGAMAMGSLFLAIMLVTILSVGMVGAALGVGIGGFVAEFGHVDASDANAQIYPVLGENPACENAPQLMASIDGEATITEEVAFYKDLPLPDDFTNADLARVAIESDLGTNEVDATDLDLRLTALVADELNLGDATDGADSEVDIQEFERTGTEGAEDAYADPDEDITGIDDIDGSAEFGIAVSGGDGGMTIDSGTAVTHSVSFQALEGLQDVSMAVLIGEETDFESDPLGDDEIAVRQVDGGADCDELATESNPDSPETPYFD